MLNRRQWKQGLLAILAITLMAPGLVAQAQSPVSISAPNPLVPYVSPNGRYLALFNVRASQTVAHSGQIWDLETHRRILMSRTELDWFQFGPGSTTALFRMGANQMMQLRQKNHHPAIDDLGSRLLDLATGQIKSVDLAQAGKYGPEMIPVLGFGSHDQELIYYLQPSQSLVRVDLLHQTRTSLSLPLPDLEINRGDVFKASHALGSFVYMAHTGKFKLANASAKKITPLPGFGDMSPTSFTFRNLLDMDPTGNWLSGGLGGYSRLMLYQIRSQKSFTLYPDSLSLAVAFDAQGQRVLSLERLQPTGLQYVLRIWNLGNWRKEADIPLPDLDPIVNNHRLHPQQTVFWKQSKPCLANSDGLIMCWNIASKKFEQESLALD